MVLELKGGSSNAIASTSSGKLLQGSKAGDDDGHDDDDNNNISGEEAEALEMGQGGESDRLLAPGLAGPLPHKSSLQ